MADKPASVTQATFPAEYGSRGGEGDEPIEWGEVEQLLRQSPNYWVTTVSRDGRPHPRPVDGVWVGGALCFGGSPQALWVRNLEANPAVSVHLPSGEDVVILNGTASRVTNPEHPLAGPSREASKAKYPQYYGGGDELPPFQPFWAVAPAVVYTWRLEGFPQRATRFVFDT